MSDSLQLSIDLATSLSIIFAAVAFIFQQWKENYEKKELGLWQEIREVIDSQADTMLESIRILIQMEYNPDEIPAREENPDNALEAEFTEFLNIINTVKFRVRLDSKPKIEALLKRQDTYEAMKNKLDKIFIEFDNECDALIEQSRDMRKGAKIKNDKKAARDGLIKAIFGDEFMSSEQKAIQAAYWSSEEKAKLDAARAAEGKKIITEIFSLNMLFKHFSEALFELAYDKKRKGLVIKKERDS